MQDMHTIKSVILADGKIDAEEVATLRNVLFEDGQIDQSEADLLFELNNKCSGADNDPAWATLFVDAISSFLLDDGQCLGKINTTESAWLLQQLMGDGKLDDVEKKVLRRISERAKIMPDELARFIKVNM